MLAVPVSAATNGAMPPTATAAMAIPLSQVAVSFVCSLWTSDKAQCPISASTCAWTDLPKPSRL